MAVENVRREGRGGLTGLLTIIAMIKMRPLAKKKEEKKKPTQPTGVCRSNKPFFHTQKSADTPGARGVTRE